MQPPKKRTGRPKMGWRDRRTYDARVPLTYDEREQFGAAAAKAKMPLAAWFRRAAKLLERRDR